MDRVVLVTGTSSGIGLATALAFAGAGDTVNATMRDIARSATLDAAAEAGGLKVEVRQLDVSSDESVTEAVAAALAEHGRIDVLVNNAGLGMVATLEELTIDDIRRSLDVNFLGVVRTT